jgi:hypothetical protein
VLKALVSTSRSRLNTIIEKKQFSVLKPETFYSSQSGRIMRIPGTAGTRIHEICPFGWKNVASKLDILHKLCDARPDSVELWTGAGADLMSDTTRRWTDLNLFTTRINNKVELDMALQHREFISFTDIYVRCQDNSGSNLTESIDLIRSTKSAGLQARAYICDLFEYAANIDSTMVQDVIAALADADADVIMISDPTDEAVEETLR